jgi:hypothetical protein
LQRLPTAGAWAVRRQSVLKHGASARFALAALRGQAQLQLNIVKAQANLGLPGDRSVRNSVANANNHCAKRIEWAMNLL